MSNKIIIVGAGGHGKVVADIAKRNGYTEIAFLDDNDSITMCGCYPIIGKCDEAVRFNDYDFIVAIGNGAIRHDFQKWLISIGGRIVSLIHPTAVVADGVKIGNGTVVMAGAVINPDAKIGHGCIINTCASVDHDCIIEDFVHVSVGSHIAGTVKIGKRTWIGAGATVNNNLEITSDCVIGSGAVVICDIAESGTYVGVPARQIHNH